MFRIGEFSKLTQVSVRMLRYYDETGLLKPSQTDSFTGYRLYSSEQIPRLNKIIFLRDLGFKVAEIDHALSNWHDIQIILDRRRKKIEDNIEIERNKLSLVNAVINDLQQQPASGYYDVTIKKIPGCKVLSLRKIVPSYFEEGCLWKELSGFMNRNNIPSNENTFAIYHDLEYKEEQVDIEVCAEVKELGHSSGNCQYRITEPVPFMACSMVYGPFENINKAYLSFAAWLEQHHQYQMTGTSRQVVHRGPWNEQDSSQYLTEVQIPLKKRT